MAASYTQHNLSLFDTAYSPRYYMGVMLCFPFDTKNAQRVNRATIALEGAAADLISQIPIVAGAISLDLKNPASGKLVVREPADRGKRISVIRVIKHDNFEYSFSELQAKNFSSPEWPTHVLSPFPKRPDPGLEIPVCGVQANFIDGGLLLVFCLHHGVADGFWARVVLGVFLGSLAGIKSVVPKRLTYNLEKLEGSLELQDQSTLLAACPERSLRSRAAALSVTPSTSQHGTTSPLSVRHFTLPATLSHKLKAAASALLKPPFAPSSPPNPTPSIKHISRNDCAAAFVWAHITAARFRSPATSIYGISTTNPTRTSRLFLPIDCRGRLDKPADAIPKQYFGNAILTVPTTATISTLIIACDVLTTTAGANAFAQIVAAIRTAINGIDAAYIRSRLVLAKSVVDSGSDIRRLALNLDPAANVDVVFNNLSFLNSGGVRLHFSGRGFEDGGEDIEAVAVRKLHPAAAGGVVTAFAGEEIKGESGEDLVLEVPLREGDMEKLVGMASWVGAMGDF